MRLETIVNNDTSLSIYRIEQGKRTRLGTFNTVKEAKLFKSVYENRQRKANEEWRESAQLLGIQLPPADFVDIVLRFGGRI